MNARHIVMSLALSLLGTGLWAQSDLPQVFSPNAVELGKYGRVPVSYFNGLPNISIPLTELKARNYTLPIYLTYHASGNKPDQHPGWVGLGWSLHAGGCINRVINGMKDEMSQLEYEDLYSAYPSHHPGYYFHSGSTQQTDWSNPQVLADSLVSAHVFDWDPDEFQICLEDIQASFYFTGDGEIQIVSKSAVDFIVDVHLANGSNNPIIVYPGPNVGSETGRAKRYYYFDRITLTASDGTKYVFGDNDNAIEYSMPLIPDYYPDPATGGPVNANNWICRATANSWMLSRIERPDGEVITFTYSKDGTPVVRQDVHFSEICIYDGTPRIEKKYDTKSDPNQLRNISFCLIQPSYLQSITCRHSPDNLVFSRAQTTELKYATTQQEFEKRAGNYTYTNSAGTYYSYAQIMASDYYMQLSGISGPKRNIQLSYSSDSNKRLTLQQVSFLNASSSSDHRYTFEYNSVPLPSYHARQTDLWGFYNGVSFDGVSYNGLEQVRSQIDAAKTKAEILTTIHYPTGGTTEFEYENHTYSKEVTPITVELSVKNADAIAGGLRIREIRDYPVNGPMERRVFNYQDLSGLSSGILAGLPQLYVSGHCTMTLNPHLPLNGNQTWFFDGVYVIGSEYPVRPLSTTDGNHVTYSQVKETASDGSNSQYRYSNHDLSDCCDKLPLWRGMTTDSLLYFNAFNTRELFRGLLLQKADYDVNGRLICDEQNEYNMDTTTFVKSINVEKACEGLLACYSYRAIYDAFPYLKKKTVTLYADGSDATPHIEKNYYTYDSHRRLTQVKRIVGGVTERDTYSYTGNYSNAPFTGMKARNMIALPVEHRHTRKDTTTTEKYVGAELTTWKELSSGRFVPAMDFVAALGEGVTSFTAFNGNTKDSHYGTAEIVYEQYDTLATLLRAKDRSGLPSTYYWNKHSVKPTFIARDAMNGEQTRMAPGAVTKTEVDMYTSVQTIVKDFTSEEAGPISMTFTPEGNVSDVVMTLDGDTLHVWEMAGPNGTTIAYDCYVGTGSVPFPAGYHEVRVTCIRESDLPPINPLNLTRSLPEIHLPFSGTLRISYTGRGLVQQSFTGNDLYFNDFESYPGGASGYHSGKGCGESFTVSVSNLDPYRRHVLDYRQRTGSGSWIYVRTSFTGSATIGGSGKTVDQVRVFPEDADVESYTWWPDGNLRSRTDSRGVTESYEYDTLGRLIAVRDNDGHIVESYQYNYHNK